MLKLHLSIKPYSSARTRSSFTLKKLSMDQRRNLQALISAANAKLILKKTSLEHSRIITALPAS